MNVLSYLDDIITNDSKNSERNLVIRPSDFQMSYLDPRKIFRFEIFLTVDGEPVERSEHAIHMATPAEGLFVLYEIRNMKLPWKDIDGCLIKVYDHKGNVEIHTTLKFYGLRMRPRRCTLIDNDNLSRAIVAWHTRPGNHVEEPKTQVKEEHNPEVTQSALQAGVILLPPTSSEESSSVSNILGRLRNIPEMEDPVLPPS